MDKEYKFLCEGQFFMLNTPRDIFGVCSKFVQNKLEPKAV